MGPALRADLPLHVEATRDATATTARSRALSRLARVRPADYARTRNHVQGAVTGLSPYITHGVLTLPEVLAAVLHRGPLAVGHKLVYELGWREFFRHVWACRGSDIFQSLHGGPLPESAYAPVVPDDIRQARTGAPVIDEAVRELYTSGALHNHARMWLASYVVHLRRVHWRAGADWMVAHLLDGDLASNHLSWQWVAGTGSHKPYLFNAENVARYAPAAWHSAGTVLDQSYESLERIARGGPISKVSSAVDAGDPEPILLAEPPDDLRVARSVAFERDSLAGRQVWLVHPWALRAPPPDMPADALVLGVYLSEHHTRWPWAQARWRWVEAAMSEITAERWYTDVRTLAHALAGAARVRSVDDLHIRALLEPMVQLDPAPALFPRVDRPCASFSQWWTRATRGLHSAQALL
jgi:deoxyribodipyrimidine photo-lyase